MHPSNMYSNLLGVRDVFVDHRARLTIGLEAVCLASNVSSMRSGIYVDTYLADPLHFLPRHALEFFASMDLHSDAGYMDRKQVILMKLDQIEQKDAIAEWDISDAVLET